MGISSSTSTSWLFIHCVQIEKHLGARTRTNYNKPNPHIYMTPGPRVEPGPHWRRVLSPLCHPCSPCHPAILVREEMGQNLAVTGLLEYI